MTNTTKAKGNGAVCEHGIPLCTHGCGNHEEHRKMVINLTQYLLRGETVTVTTSKTWVRYIPHFDQVGSSPVEVTGELAVIEVVEQTHKGASHSFKPMKATR